MFHKEYSDLGAFPARGIQRRIFSELPPFIAFQLNTTNRDRLWQEKIGCLHLVGNTTWKVEIFEFLLATFCT